MGGSRSCRNSNTPFFSILRGRLPGIKIPSTGLYGTVRRERDAVTEYSTCAVGRAVDLGLPPSCQFFSRPSGVLFRRYAGVQKETLAYFFSCDSQYT